MSEKSETYRFITSLMEKGEMDRALKEIEAQAQNLSRPEELECRGNYHFYEKRKQQAVDKYEEAMKNCPDYDCARYHYIIGVQEELRGSNVEAYDRYNASIRIEPSFADAYVELGGLLAKIGDYEVAAKVYEDARNLDPQDLRIYFNLMEVYRVLAPKSEEFARRFKQAQKEYQELAPELGPLPKNHQW